MRRMHRELDGSAPQIAALPDNRQPWSGPYQMALIKCKECGARVSAGAKACPGCGFRGLAGGGLEWRQIASIAGILAVLIGGTRLYLGYQSEAESTQRATDERIIQQGLRDAMSPEQYRQYTADNLAAADRAAKAEKAASDRKAEQLSAISAAESDVRKILRDPSSAQFGTKNFYSNPGAMLGITICGYVNAKNAFGAYGGSKGYIVIDRQATLEDQGGDFVSTWNRLCK